MTGDAQIQLVERYFKAVDGEDLTTILSTLRPDCRFSVETHQVHLEGHNQIANMFHRLWSNHRAVRHHSFVFVADPVRNRIAAQFQVENTELDGSLTHKSNCNVFDCDGAQFARVAVYMAGPNTLNTA